VIVTCFVERHLKPIVLLYPKTTLKKPLHPKPTVLLLPTHAHAVKSSSKSSSSSRKSSSYNRSSSRQAADRIRRAPKTPSYPTPAAAAAAAAVVAMERLTKLKQGLYQVVVPAAVLMPQQPRRE
jgi:hypothetical protein